MEVLGIVAVSPQHVRLDEIREDQSLVELTQELLCLRNSVDVRLRRVRFVDVLAGEDVSDLPDAVDPRSGVAYKGEVVGALRLEREVVTVRCPLVVARLTDEW